MFNLVRKNKPVKTTKKQWIQIFYKTPEHDWILEDKYIKANFDDFLESVPTSLIREMITKFNIVFVPITAKFSCAVSRANVVLIFPELYDLLSSTALSPFKGILVHEIAHIALEHGTKQLSVMKAQVEADAFAIELGFSEDLENFLLDLPESIEKRIRLSYLTSRYYNSNM